MRFQTVGYQSDSGEIYKMRIDENSVSAAGGSAGAPTSSMFVKITKSDREFGLRPRFVTLSETFTTTGGRSFKEYRRLPMTTLAAWNAVAEDSTLTVGGKQYDVVGKEKEDY